MTRQDRLAPGVVQVRLSGHPDDTGALAAVLASSPAVQILTGPDGPYPSRRQPGHRLYLTLQFTNEKEPPMSAEPAYDASNVHLAQGQTADSMQFLAAADTGPEAADPDAPIPCTLTPKAETYLASLTAELSPAGPEPEAGL